MEMSSDIANQIIYLNVLNAVVFFFFSATAFNCFNMDLVLSKKFKELYFTLLWTILSIIINFSFIP